LIRYFFTLLNKLTGTSAAMFAVGISAYADDHLDLIFE